MHTDLPVPTGVKKTAVMCIVHHAGKFLLLKRAFEPHLGLYTPVGGRLDPFESPELAAVREIAEETGLAVAAARYRGLLVESSPTSFNWTSFVYTAEVDTIATVSSEEGELVWLSADEMLHVPTPETDAILFEYIVSSRPFAFMADYDADKKLIKMSEEIEGRVVFDRATP